MPTSAPIRLAPGQDDELAAEATPGSQTTAPSSAGETVTETPQAERATPLPVHGAPTNAGAAEAAAAKTAADKRVDDRAAISLRVDYKRLNTFFADYTKNISKGGTFIRTTKPLDIGTEFIFVLSVPSHNQQLELKGEVVWIVTEESATRDSPAGMGIKFKFVDESERSAVDDFVEKLMDEALGHHISTKLLRRS
jgi:type IV pilus assembly protein PilZ